MDKKNLFQFWLNKELDLDMKIYRYMDFDVLLQILNNKFFVSRKYAFSDKFDTGMKIPLQLLYKLDVMDKGKIIPCVEKKYSLEGYYELVKKSKNYLASCWTTNKDDILMWNSYTQAHCGVCIESTIKKVLNSLQPLEGYHVYCSKMYYAGYDQLEDTEEYLFRKLSSYQHENEIRFYFLEDNIVNLLKENVESEKLPPKYFNVSPEDMILHLYFSPFIRGDSAKYQEDLLVKHFSFLQDRIETFNFKNR